MEAFISYLPQKLPPPMKTKADADNKKSVPEIKSSLKFSKYQQKNQTKNFAICL